MSSKDLLNREQLLTCLELGKDLTAELDGDQLLSIFLEKLSLLLPAQSWSMLLLDEESQELRFEASVDLDPEVVKSVRLPLGQGVAGQVALTQKPMIVPDVSQSTHFHQKVDQLSGTATRSLICVPLIFGGRSLGVIEVINPQSLGGEELALLSVVADYAAIAVENTRRYQRIQEMAVHDNLTGLYNTRYLYRALADQIQRAQSSDLPFSLIFMDLDNFKRVVDTYGHLNGSRAIQEAAGTIRGTLRAPEFAVAYGGDEFVVVLPGCDKAGALAKAREIKAGMGRTQYLAEQGFQISLSASFGVATFPDDATTREALLALADQAMFRVKDSGKNAVQTV